MKRKWLLLFMVLCVFTLWHEQAEARYYDARTGRFLTVDSRAKDFPRTSPYVYTLNSPLKYTDPDGKMPILAPIAGVGAGVYIGGAVTIAVVGHTWNYTFNASYKRAVDQGSTSLLRVADDASTNAVNEVKAVWEAAKSLVSNVLSNDNAQGAENVKANESRKGDKSAEEYDRHQGKLNEAKNQVKDLQEKLENTKGPKKQVPIKEQIDKLKESIKGHEKEFKQKWPEGRPTN